jgi:ketosteroid isomerase-like protein
MAASQAAEASVESARALDRRNVEAVRRFYRAEADVAAPGIVWHVPGHNPVSGEYRGRDEYFELMPSRMAPLDRWDFQLGNVMVNGERVVATFTMAGDRKGQHVELSGCHLFRLNEHGQVAEGWGFVNDQDALDAFFSA